MEDNESRIQIRQAGPEDVDQLVEWTMRLHEHEKHPLDLPIKDNFQHQLTDWISSLFDQNSALVVIAESIGEEEKKTAQQKSNGLTEETSTGIGFVFGYIAPQANEFTPFAMHGVIQLLWVEKTFRKLGVAQMLVTAIEECFRQLQVPYCDVEYTATNALADGFWKKLGYGATSVTARKFFTD